MVQAWRRLAVAIPAVMACCGSAWGIPIVEFSQVDFEYDGVRYDNSEYGSARLRYDGNPAEGLAGVQYVNLSVGGVWVLRNTPVLSDAGAGENRVNFTFDLAAAGGSRGVRVPTLSYGLSVTSGLLSDMPASDQPASVGKREVAYGFGLDDRPPGDPPEVLPPAPAPVAPTGGPAGVDKTHKHKKTVPNQTTPKDQCVSAAISNSLQYLNSQNNLMMPADKISIEGVRTGCGFGDGSVNVDWVAAKIEYTTRAGLPIKTVITTSFAEAMKAIDDDCDVEIQAARKQGFGFAGHVAAVQSITENADGSYNIFVQHDMNQNSNSADDLTDVDEMYYDPTQPNAKIEQGTYFNGMKFQRFVIECPMPVPEPGSVAMVLAGGGLLLVRRRR